MKKSKAAKPEAKHDMARRRRRNKRIAAFVANGHNVNAAIAKFKVTYVIVYGACRSHGVRVAKSTRAECQARRKKFAEYVAAGHSITETARHFDDWPNTVVNACREFGVETTASRVKNLTLEIIADLQNTFLNHKQIGAKHGVTGSAVSIVAKRAAKAGIRIAPRYSPGGGPA